MSRSNPSNMRIGCPRCNATVTATVPPGAGIAESDGEESPRLRGKETSCVDCGHELALYFY